jgi:hypothetical protein
MTRKEEEEEEKEEAEEEEGHESIKKKSNRRSEVDGAKVRAQLRFSWQVLVGSFRAFWPLLSQRIAWVANSLTENGDYPTKGKVLCTVLRMRHIQFPMATKSAVDGSLLRLNRKSDKFGQKVLLTVKRERERER